MTIDRTNIPSSLQSPEGLPYVDRLDRISRYVNGPYVQLLHRLGLDFEVVRAEGAAVFDRAGRRFIDCVAGYGNLNVGHNHPHVIEAVVAELRSPRPFNLPFLSASQAQLAVMLATVTPGDLECSFVVNSGSEAVDSALKLARLATGRSDIIAARGAWHGFTFGAMSVSERSMLRSFEPLVPGVTTVPYGDAAAVEAAITRQTAAVIVEPIQSESGAIIPPSGYLQQLCKLCTQHDVVLIFDEVKCGLGKTGRLWACEHENAVPDVLLAGKSLGGGAMPIGTVTARQRLWSRFGFSFPMSSSSGAGNAPACAAAVATLQVIERERLPEKAAHSGARLTEGLKQLAADYPNVVRGMSGTGLLLALHLNGLKASNAVVQGCVERGVLVMAAFCDRTRILIEPPLSIGDADVDSVLHALTESVQELAAAS